VMVTFLILGLVDMGVLNFGKKFSSQGSSNVPVPKFNKDTVPNPKPQGGGGNGSSISTCTRCGMRHDVKCSDGTYGFFGCGKSSHKVKD